MTAHGGDLAEFMALPVYRRAHDAYAGQAERIADAAGRLRNRAERLSHAVKHRMGVAPCLTTKLAKSVSGSAAQ